MTWLAKISIMITKITVKQAQLSRGGVLMEDRKKELLKKIATEFPALKESEKYYIAGYISHAEDTRAEKMKVQTA